MKINIIAKRWLCFLSVLTVSIITTTCCQARVIDNNPVTDQRWIISEIYLGGDDYSGAYIEIYNNDEHTSLGWKDFVINLPFDIDLPPVYDLHTYKPHAYKKLSLDEGIMGWLAKKYIQIMYGDSVFHEIEDALDEQDNYSYQRCQTTYEDGTVVLSNKFYYGKKTPGKAIECEDKSITVTNPDDAMTGTCEKLKLNEIGSYMEPEEQFIEVVNNGAEPLNLANCYIAKSKAKSAVHAQLDDYEVEPGGLYVFNVDQTDLEYIAKTSGILYLIDSDDETVVNYKRYSSVKEGASMAIDNNGEWQMTYQMTPGEDNVIEVYPPCPEGQYRDENTHRCRNIPEEDDDDSTTDDDELDENGLKPCKEGYYRNPETNRCKKIPTDEDDELEPCPDGYYRNPETNRCKKIDNGEDDLVPCREGYVRNPATNRCVKIKDEDKDDEDTDKDDDAKYPVTTTDNDNAATSTTSLIIVVAIITIVSLAILIWQYRQEIGRWWHRLCNRTKQPAKPTATKTNRLLDQSDKSNTDEWLDKLTDNSKKQ